MPTPDHLVIRLHRRDGSSAQAAPQIDITSLLHPRATKLHKRCNGQAHRLFRYSIDAGLAAPDAMERSRYQLFTTTASAGVFNVYPVRSAVHSTPSRRDNRQLA